MTLLLCLLAWWAVGLIAPVSAVTCGAGQYDLNSVCTNCPAGMRLLFTSLLFCPSSIRPCCFVFLIAQLDLSDLVRVGGLLCVGIPGKYTAASSTTTSCVPCASGRYALAGASTCLFCSSNQFPDSTQGQCLACNLGTLWYVLSCCCLHSSYAHHCCLQYCVCSVESIDHDF
jgi:hypothetical protein